MKTVSIVFHTRPKAIKMCPLVNELKRHSQINTIVYVACKHWQILKIFNIVQVRIC